LLSDLVGTFQLNYWIVPTKLQVPSIKGRENPDAMRKKTSTPRRVTILDIAAQAGVSKSTVSLVLHDSALIRRETGTSRSCGVRADLAIPHQFHTDEQAGIAHAADRNERLSWGWAQLGRAAARGATLRRLT
jgi:hypothetical protein